MRSAESKATQAANNKEMLGECHDIVWCQTIILTVIILVLQVVAECLRLCARRGGSRGVAAVVSRSNKGQLQEQLVM